MIYIAFKSNNVVHQEKGLLINLFICLAVVIAVSLRLSPRYERWNALSCRNMEVNEGVYYSNKYSHSLGKYSIYFARLSLAECNLCAISDYKSISVQNYIQSPRNFPVIILKIYILTKERRNKIGNKHLKINFIFVVFIITQINW